MKHSEKEEGMNASFFIKTNGEKGEGLQAFSHDVIYMIRECRFVFFAITGLYTSSENAAQEEG